MVNYTTGETNYCTCERKNRLGFEALLEKLRASFEAEKERLPKIVLVNRQLLYSLQQALFGGFGSVQIAGLLAPTQID
jgi:hypothetical protein